MTNSRNCARVTARSRTAPRSSSMFAHVRDCMTDGSAAVLDVSIAGVGAELDAQVLRCTPGTGLIADQLAGERLGLVADRLVVNRSLVGSEPRSGGTVRGQGARSRSERTRSAETSW